MPRLFPLHHSHHHLLSGLLQSLPQSYPASASLFSHFQCIGWHGPGRLQFRSWYFCSKNFKDLLLHLEGSFSIGLPIPSHLIFCCGLQPHWPPRWPCVHQEHSFPRTSALSFLCLEQVPPRELHTLFLYFPYIYQFSSDIQSGPTLCHPIYIYKYLIFLFYFICFCYFKACLCSKSASYHLCDIGLFTEFLINY